MHQLVSGSVKQLILDAKVGPPLYEKGLAKDILSVVSFLNLLPRSCICLCTELINGLWKINVTLQCEIRFCSSIYGIGLNMLCMYRTLVPLHQAFGEI